MQLQIEDNVCPAPLCPPYSSPEAAVWPLGDPDSSTEKSSLFRSELFFFFFFGSEAFEPCLHVRKGIWFCVCTTKGLGEVTFTGQKSHQWSTEVSKSKETETAHYFGVTIMHVWRGCSGDCWVGFLHLLPTRSLNPKVQTFGLHAGLLGAPASALMSLSDLTS